MTPGTSDAANRPNSGATDHDTSYDPSIVPGLVDPVPAPRADPVGGSRPLDPSKDPDRYNPDVDPTANLSVVGPLDPRRDPDRFRAGQGQSLTDLIGKSGAHEDERDNYAWALGLLGVLAFLGLVAFLFGEVLSQY